MVNARVAQLVERQPSKLMVAGSNPVSRSFFRRCSSGVERFLGKEEVGSSNLLAGSPTEGSPKGKAFFLCSRANL